MVLIKLTLLNYSLSKQKNKIINWGFYTLRKSETNNVWQFKLDSHAKYKQLNQSSFPNGILKTIICSNINSANDVNGWTIAENNT